MAQSLEDHARARLAALQAFREQAGKGLAAARTDLDRRHPDPDAVAPGDWATELGATQQVATARAALAAVRAEQDRIRARLAAVASPADTATYEAQLRAAMITDAGLRVRLREATERVAGSGAAAEAWSGLLDRAQAVTAAAEAELKAAARWQANAAQLRAALAQPPVSSVVDAATAVDLGPAQKRLTALLPDDLHTRARARAAEADDLRFAAADAADAGETARAAEHAKAHPLDAAGDTARSAFLRALAALRHYVGTAVAELGAARAALKGVVALPDLTVAQTQALDPTNRATAVAAAKAEADLATAVAKLAEKQRAVDDAVVGALGADPDADPTKAATVVDAVAHRDAPDVQDPLKKARAAYTADAAAAFDAWEVEVPDAVWRAAVDLTGATQTLARLGDRAARDGLVTALDATGDAFAAALDAEALQVRRELAVAAALVGRTAAAAAADATAADRAAQYVRGDGPGGRLPAQL